MLWFAVKQLGSVSFHMSMKPEVIPEVGEASFPFIGWQLTKDYRVMIYGTPF